MTLLFYVDFMHNIVRACRANRVNESRRSVAFGTTLVTSSSGSGLAGVVGTCQLMTMRRHAARLGVTTSNVEVEVGRS